MLSCIRGSVHRRTKRHISNDKRPGGTAEEIEKGIKELGEEVNRLKDRLIKNSQKEWR